MESIQEENNIVDFNDNNAGVIIINLEKQVIKKITIYQNMLQECKKLYDFLGCMYSNYRKYCQEKDVEEIPLEDILYIKEFEQEEELENERIPYFKALYNIPLDIQTVFFKSEKFVFAKHIEEISKTIEILEGNFNDIFDYINKTSRILVGDGEKNIFNLFCFLVKELKNKNSEYESVLNQINYIIKKVVELEKNFKKFTGRQLDIDNKMIEQTYRELINNNEKNDDKKIDETQIIKKEYTKQEKLSIIESLRNSSRKILEYSEIDIEKIEEMQNYLDEFYHMKDKNSVDDFARKLRFNLSKTFYEIYEKVFIKSLSNENKENYIELFLTYGYLDDRFFDDETLFEIFELSEEQEINCENVYNIKQWFLEIYEGKREPSINEFDIDYKEFIREKTKKEKLSKQEEMMWLKNQEEKVRYEIRNMFKVNHRLTSMQVSTFVPILYTDLFLKDIKSMIVTKGKLDEAIEKLLEIDFSAFHRECLYHDTEKGINKEQIMKKIIPDIILMPTVGAKGIMWQEISEKKRDTSSRFLFPIFSIKDIEDLLIPVVGAYRWEICRTMQGTYWNDIREKSLTSEYSNYIQFYKKNKELSEQVKEKVKLQLIKSRNNTRESFIKDYQIWIKNESQGAIRLNKVVRGILFTYCPFSKEFRDKLKGQPMYSELQARFEREREKKIKELKGRYNFILKNGGEITEFLKENLKFYEEL